MWWRKGGEIGPGDALAYTHYLMPVKENWAQVLQGLFGVQSGPQGAWAQAIKKARGPIRALEGSLNGWAQDLESPGPHAGQAGSDWHDLARLGQATDDDDDEDDDEHDWQ